MSAKTVRRWSTMGGALAVLLAVGSLAGCGKKGDRCWVSGKVTLNNKPIADGGIRFLPRGGTPGPGAAAAIKDGQYEIPKSAGMMAGSYTLMFSATRPATKAEIARMGNEAPGADRDPGDDQDDDPRARLKPPAPVVQLIPESLNTVKALAADLTAGENTKDFSLSGQPGY
jgi:hypothetical protein